MPWNPSPEVAVARDAANKLGADQVVLVAINYAKDQLAVITYGRTKALCDEAKLLGSAAYGAVYEAIEQQPPRR